jgi:hypothetical protein
MEEFVQTMERVGSVLTRARNEVGRLEMSRIAEGSRRFTMGERARINVIAQALATEFARAVLGDH